MTFMLLKDKSRTPGTEARESFSPAGKNDSLDEKVEVFSTALP
jgi:hypothetical protein